jgi:NAD(P)-dependent dehydrogenase (short-subunit alcohol dehydrogenase family)
MMAVDSVSGKLAVVTGGGSGIGRELVCQLAAAGCSAAACDWHADAVAATVAMARSGAPDGVLITGHGCDVSDEAQVLQFRADLLAEHATDHVDMVFSNAGIGGGGSFVNDSRQEWERTFAVDWWGVYLCARAFLPLLISSGDGVLVNTSSLNGLWASLGPGAPNTAYSTAKFAVRGFTEALIEDLRTNAPQVRVALVLPGSVGTDIIANTRRAHGTPGPEDMTDEQIEEARDFLVKAKLVAEHATPEEVRTNLARLETEGKDKALLGAGEAATIILDGVRSGAWRILVGQDAAFVDERIRSRPESAYDYAEVFKDLPAGLLQGAKDLPEGVRDLLPDWVKGQLPDAEPDNSPGQQSTDS